MASLGFGYSALLSGSQTIDAKARRLSIDCGSMRLLKEGKVEFAGAGFFRQNAEGQLECALFDSVNPPGTGPLAQMAVSPGTWLSVADYY